VSDPSNSPDPGEPRIQLPGDDELPPEVRDALANLPPLNVFRMVAKLPASFRPFLQLGGSLLSDEAIDPRTREIAILRVAHVTGAAYEWAQHAQLARNVGVSDEEIDAIRSATHDASLAPEDVLVCRVADEISRDVRLSDEALELLLDRYGERGACSLILCVAYYNMVSRFLESTRVQIEAEELLSGQTPGAFVGRDRASPETARP
jgi:4-carboxymuconolactone decarboxylase